MDGVQQLAVITDYRPRIIGRDFFSISKSTIASKSATLLYAQTGEKASGNLGILGILGTPYLGNSGDTIPISPTENVSAGGRLDYGMEVAAMRW